MYFKETWEEAFGRVPASFPGHRAPGRWAVPPRAAHRGGPREGLGGGLTTSASDFLSTGFICMGLKNYNLANVSNLSRG